MRNLAPGPFRGINIQADSVPRGLGVFVDADDDVLEGGTGAGVSWVDDAVVCAAEEGVDFTEGGGSWGDICRDGEGEGCGCEEGG